MKLQLQLEGLGLFLLFLLAYIYLNYEMKWFFILFFAPDLSFVGYAINKKLGTIAYNLLHHQGFFAVVFALSFWQNIEALQVISLTFLAHSAFDRMWGYGLKYADSFHNTHMGWMGNAKKN